MRRGVFEGERHARIPVLVCLSSSANHITSKNSQQGISKAYAIDFITSRAIISLICSHRLGKDKGQIFGQMLIAPLEGFGITPPSPMQVKMDAGMPLPLMIGAHSTN
jgi:hypothetical protein